MEVTKWLKPPPASCRCRCRRLRRMRRLRRACATAPRHGARDRLRWCLAVPEHGAAGVYFPIDDMTLRYLRLTGRDEVLIRRVEAYAKCQMLWRYPDAPVDPSLYDEVIEFDLSNVEPSLAGPNRPEQRVSLSGVRGSFARAFGERTDDTSAGTAGGHSLANGDVVIGDHELHQHRQSDRNARSRPARAQFRKAGAQGEVLGEDVVCAGLGGGARLHAGRRLAGPSRRFGIPDRWRPVWKTTLLRAGFTALRFSPAIAISRVASIRWCVQPIWHRPLSSSPMRSMASPPIISPPTAPSGLTVRLRTILPGAASSQKISVPIRRGAGTMRLQFGAFGARSQMRICSTKWSMVRVGVNGRSYRRFGLRMPRWRYVIHGLCRKIPCRLSKRPTRSFRLAGRSVHGPIGAHYPWQSDSTFLAPPASRLCGRKGGHARFSKPAASTLRAAFTPSSSRASRSAAAPRAIGPQKGSAISA
jgi:hypothetical protein